MKSVHKREVQVLEPHVYNISNLAVLVKGKGDHMGP